MSNDLPTPEELGDRLKRGEISKEEAIEVMSERARREALAGLYGPPTTTAPATAGTAGRPAGRGRRLAILVLAVVILILLMWWLAPSAG